MRKLHVRLLSSTAIGAALIAGTVGAPSIDAVELGIGQAVAQNPCAAKNPCAAANPCAAKNPCAAATSPCNPCNPCAGRAPGGATTACVVPRLASARPNPCAATKACNPCAARNPYNPCAAKTNPCAAKNPCAARNPCAATSPCAAANPCSPCGAAAPPELTDAEAKLVGECITGPMRAAYAKAPIDMASTFWNWSKYSTQPYQSATHGQRFVHNYGNREARAYGRYEEAGELPVGAQLAKPSFTVGKDGRASVGPLFVMEKMPEGFLAQSGDWKYTMVLPDGSIFGQTKGKNSAGMQFCIGCHQAAADNDHLMFLPEEYRVSR